MSVSLCFFQLPLCLPFPLSLPHPTSFIPATFFQSSHSLTFWTCAAVLPQTDTDTLWDPTKPHFAHRLIGIRHTGPSKLPWLALTANMSHEIDLGCMFVCVPPRVCCTGGWGVVTEKGGSDGKEDRKRKRAWQRFRERMKMWGQQGDRSFISPQWKSGDV